MNFFILHIIKYIYLPAFIVYQSNNNDRIDNFANIYIYNVPLFCDIYFQPQ